jgi:hypothetical protein
MGVAQLPSYQALCGPVNNQQQKEPTEVNCFGMVDITLSAFDYLILRRGVNYGRLHKPNRDRGYWLTWGDGELETYARIEDAVRAFERVTSPLDRYEVRLGNRR